MRQGKTTIIDTGVLGQAERRRDNSKGQREKFTTYSAVKFLDWLRRGRSFDDTTLERVLISACLQLPDTPAPSPKVATVLLDSTKKPTKAVSTPANVRNEPDSFVRQRKPSWSSAAAIGVWSRAKKGWSSFGRISCIRDHGRTMKPNAECG